MIDFLKKNKEKIKYIIIGLVIGLIIMGIIWPKESAKLSDGSNVVVEAGDVQISADQYFKKLKDNDNLKYLLRMLDLSLTKEIYTDADSDASDYATKQYTSSYNLYSQYGYSETQFLSMAGYSSKDAFLDYLKDDYYLQKYEDDYVSTLISDSDVQTYYDENAFGPKRLYIFSSTTSSTDLESVRTALKAGKSVSDIKSTYTNVVVNDMSTVYFTDLGNYSSSMTSYIKTLGKGEYTKVFSDDTYGYVVLYVSEVGDKPTFDDSKDNIRSALVTQMETSDSNMMYEAMIHLQTENNIKFADDDIESAYKTYVKTYNKASTSSSTES
ncbi:MAG TPA: peptidyl-prolyl cis-trans isomerase [Bacilli bacterium]|jgi:hypothetical protein|nr:peptidyl-prolyl cis-trans isomerase [Bacilli bacterium]